MRGDEHHHKTMTQRGYARSRNLAASTISREVAQGKIPVDENGRIVPLQADKARSENLVHNAKYKNISVNNEVTGLAVEAEEPEADPITRQARREMVKTVLAEIAKLPEILVELGLKDPVPIVVAAGVVVHVVLNGLEFVDRQLVDADVAAFEISFPKLLKQAGMKFTPAVEAEAEAMFDRFAEIVMREPK